jgi:ssDNA-binding Zn-finger/Zn-ribbon topoisomerase 1
MSCPVCGEKLIISQDTAKGVFYVCPKMDKDSFNGEEVVHYRKSLLKLKHGGSG